MTRRVAAAEAKAKFSELVSRVAHGGERVIIERHGKPVAALVSIGELEQMPSKGSAPLEDDPWLRSDPNEPEIPDELWDRFEQIVRTSRSESRPPPDFSDG